MFTSFRTVFAFTTVALASTNAQDLNADVVRDPAANIATYDFHFDGPPGGSAFLYGSFGVLPRPLPILGIFGNLEIEPNGAAFVCPVFYNPVGQAQCQLVLPMQTWEHFNLHFQALVVDPALNVAFTPAVALVQGAGPAAPAAPCIEWAGSYSRNPDTYSLRVLGPPGTQIRLLVNGGQKAIGMGIIPPGGTLNLQVPVNLVKGDGIAIEKNGQVVRSWIW